MAMITSWQPGGVGGGSHKFTPTLKGAALPGQEEEDPRAWSVEDVGEWLSSLALGQYRESFADAAVDGAFLLDLNDEDLRNTLGIDHALHRKKILNSVRRLAVTVQAARVAEGGVVAGAGGAGGAGQIVPVGGTGGGALAPAVDPLMPELALATGGGGGGGGAGGGGDIAPGGQAAEEAMPEIKFETLESFIRHAHYKKLKEALRGVPDRRFDPQNVDSQYLPDFGTQYVTDYERQRFHLNKVDQFGNTLLLIAAQNGNMKIAKLLFAKGANTNHQNKQGQTALHYAMEYNYFDLGTWLADSQNGGGADDTLENQYQLVSLIGCVIIRHPCVSNVHFLTFSTVSHTHTHTHTHPLF